MLTIRNDVSIVVFNETKCTMKFELNLNEQKIVKWKNIELMKLLKFLGLVESGTEAKMFIDNGEVQVNGETEMRRRRKLRSGDKIKFEGEEIIVV